MELNSEEVPDKKEKSDDASKEREFPTADPSSAELDMSSAELRIGPVAPEDHYRVFKFAEAQFRQRIQALEPPHYLTGLRVSYDQEDSFNEPFEFPFSLEFGDPLVIDRFLKEGVLEAEFSKPGEAQGLKEDELRKITQNEPIPYDTLKTVFEQTRIRLRQASKQDITVGLYVEVRSNPIQQAAMACRCGRQLKRFARSTTTTGSKGTACDTKCPPSGGQ